MFLISLPGGGEWLLILLIVLLLFGGRKIPELMRGIGRGIREFRAAKDAMEEEIKKGMEEAEEELKSEEKKVEAPKPLPSKSTEPKSS